MRKPTSPITAVLVTLIASITGTALILQWYAELQPKAWAIQVFDARVMSGERPLPLPALTEIVGDAASDEIALARLVDYYERHRDEIAAAFDEADETRARALFGMYAVHLAAPYNVVERVPTTLVEFIHTPTAHCGTQPLAQATLYTGLGLQWRIVSVDGGWHGYAEVVVDGRYESFDATTNVWVSRSAGELIAGMRRQYRMFYTPILDAHADGVWRVHMQDGWDVLGLRRDLPQWGISVFPAQWEVTAYSEGETE